MEIPSKTHGKMPFLILALLLFAALACKRQGVDDKLIRLEADSSSTGFLPSPQRVDERDIHTLSTGAKAVDFNLPDVSGKYYQLSDFNNANILVVIFTCNHCPTAQAYEDRIIQFTTDYKERDVSVVAIMPNSPLALLLEECGYSDLDDTYESMIIRAKDKKFNFPYLYDGDVEAVSMQYGPTATPHAFVFNKNRELVYSGRLDASEKPGTANAEDLRTAVDAAIRGQPASTPVNKAFGCSIKWAWKTEWTDKVNAEWKTKPVTLDKISKKEITELIVNPSKKLRLINVWATWCGPCIIEFPELVNLQRMFGNRNFEFISVSADKPGQSEQALEFLKSRNAAIQNYIFDSDDKYALIEAIDPAWNGALPYSILVEPGGRIVYSIQGSVDLLALKRMIVEHPMIGRYY
jgi:thiol-disulfide isomerase/thioredoxin